MRKLIVFLFLFFVFSLNAKQVRVAIIDTGIDYSHSILKKYICKGMNGKLLGYNSVEENIFPIDFNGHGTHLAGIIVKQFKKLSPKEVCIIPIKLFGEERVTLSLYHWARFIKSFAYAVASEADIINLSFEGESSNLMEMGVLHYISGKEILVVVASGNGGINLDENCNTYPACYNKDFSYGNILVVGNLKSKGVCHKTSNYGTPVDIYLKGTKIKSTSLINSYAIHSGTSMATAKASGRAAYYKVKKKIKTLDELKKYIIKRSPKKCKRPKTINGGKTK